MVALVLLYLAHRIKEIKVNVENLRGKMEQHIVGTQMNH